jgi:hypothetical protein
VANDYLPYFKFFPRDWLASPSVMLMTLAEQGAYIRILALQWENGTVPRRHLRGLLQMTEAEVDALLEGPVGECFEADMDGDLYNPRLHNERLDAMELIEKRRQAGLARAKKSAAHAGRVVPYAKAEAKAEAKPRRRRNAEDELAKAITDWERLNGAMPDDLHQALHGYLATRRDGNMPMWTREMWLKNLTADWTATQWVEAYNLASRCGWKSVHPKRSATPTPLPPRTNGTNPFKNMLNGGAQ